jgi:light-regulated signal transduction histidine kinase (bacteriophytochrome)
MWPVMADECPVRVLIQVTETVHFHENMLAMNEALMVGSVRQHELTDAVASWNARLQAEITERTQAEAALRAARLDLAQANAELEQKVRDRTTKLQETVAELEHFSYTITHDMRAPLRAMYSLGGVLLEECSECLHPTRQEYIRHIVDAAERMDKLITDALQYSGVVRQHFEPEPVDADALLRGILESYPEFQPPHANIHIDTRLPVVLGNQAGLTQCFSNLLANAVKFVHPGQIPEVRV